MSDAAVSFLDLVARGEATLDDIDDYVDRWHTSHTQQDLGAYLGMTPQEYSGWLAEPDLLATIAQARVARHTAVP